MKAKEFNKVENLKLIAVEYLEKGCTEEAMVSIARAWKYDTSQVRHRLKMMGLIPENQFRSDAAVTPKTMQEMAEHYGVGMSIADISATFRVNKLTITDVLVAMNLIKSKYTWANKYWEVGRWAEAEVAKKKVITRIPEVKVDQNLQAKVRELETKVEELKKQLGPKTKPEPVVELSFIHKNKTPIMVIKGRGKPLWVGPGQAYNIHKIISDPTMRAQFDKFVMEYRDKYGVGE